MSVGVSRFAAEAMLDELGGAIYIQLHRGDPGDDGTSNVVFVRQLVDLAPADTNARVLVASAEWATAWDSGQITVSHLSGWDASTAGNFLFSVALLSHVNFINGMIPRLTGLSIVIPSIATD